MKQKMLVFLLCIQPLYGSTLKFTYNKDFNTHVMLSSFLRDMCTTFDRSIFVETGTYVGDATEIAAALFPQVHSVEVSENLYKGACRRLESYPNIQLYNDHSVFFLDKLCSQLQVDAGSMLFWLDAHYSGGVTALYKDTLTPIVEELHTFSRHKMNDAVIMIDDIRCFGSLYKKSNLHAHPGYPSIQAVCELLKTINPSYACILYGDTLIAYDASKYNPSISPLAYACTYSRLYDGDGDLSTDSIEQEACIASADSDEAALITLLYERALRQPDDVHAFLWYGLMVTKTNPVAAQAAFRAVLERGYTHWRVYWYLAQAAYACADYDNALNYTHQTLENNPDYSPAVELQHQIAGSVRIIQAE